MVARVVHESVIREHYTLGIAESAIVVDIAFGPAASFLVGQLPFVVVELAAADALAGKNVPEIAFGAVPTCLAGFRF